jgi:hypothetical protein
LRPWQKFWVDVGLKDFLEFVPFSLGLMASDFIDQRDDAYACQCFQEKLALLRDVLLARSGPVCSLPTSSSALLS